MARKPATRRAPKALAPTPSGAVDALAVALEMEGLEALYGARTELMLRRSEVLLSRSQDHTRLEQRAEYLLGSVSVARTLAPSERGRARTPKKKRKDVAVSDPLAQVEAKARDELARAKAELADRIQAEDADFRATDERIREGLKSQASATLAVNPPSLSVHIHPVGMAKAILQVDRLADLDACLLCWLVLRKLPNRWGFFSDDAVEDLSRGPARFYAEDGVADPWVADSDEQDHIVSRSKGLLPIRMILPLPLPDRPFPRFRLVHRGPVAEVEARREGQGYDRIIDRADAELLTGYLLRLQVDGSLALSLAVD